VTRLPQRGITIVPDAIRLVIETSPKGSRRRRGDQREGDRERLDSWARNPRSDGFAASQCRPCVNAARSVARGSSGPVEGSSTGAPARRAAGLRLLLLPVDTQPRRLEQPTYHLETSLELSGDAASTVQPRSRRASDAAASTALLPIPTVRSTRRTCASVTRTTLLESVRSIPWLDVDGKGGSRTPCTW
jgi:hypothetical protein